MPVGMAVLDVLAEATEIVMVSDSPEAGLVVAAVSVVVDALSVEPEEGQAASRLLKSTDPSPVARSYPVPAA